MYDYLIVGSGLFGSVFAHTMTEQGKKCLVIDKRNHTGGNIYTREECGIMVHWYGAHIFHTDKKENKHATLSEDYFIEKQHIKKVSAT